MLKLACLCEREERIENIIFSFGYSSFKNKKYCLRSLTLAIYILNYTVFNVDVTLRYFVRIDHITIFDQNAIRRVLKRSTHNTNKNHLSHLLFNDNSMHFSQFFLKFCLCIYSEINLLGNNFFFLQIGLI